MHLQKTFHDSKFETMWKPLKPIASTQRIFLNQSFNKYIQECKLADSEEQRRRPPSRELRDRPPSR